MGARRSPSPTRQKAAAWGVHAYTALGLPLSFLGMLALYEGDARLFFGTLAATALIDATDGTLARRLRVKEVLPSFDGAMLDNLIDFLTFAFLPAMALPALGMLPAEATWVACLPLMASGYQFSQATAKTEDSFVGFPSYWNIVVFYLYVLQATPWVTTAVLALLSVLAFVPLHYLYPSKTRLWMPLTVGFGFSWAALVLVLCVYMDAPWARPVGWASLSFPAYYFIASAVHHTRRRRA